MIRVYHTTKVAIISGGLFMASIPSFAQTVAPPAQAPFILSPANENMIRAGTEVILRTREELTTKKKKLQVGYRFQMEVAEPIRLNNQIIIPAGTPAIGEVTEVRNKGMWGKSGYINGRAISLRVGDRTIRLSGAFDDKGVTGTAGVVAAIALIPIAGFFTTGTSAMVPSGTNVKAFLDEDITVSMPAAVQPVALSPVATTTVSMDQSASQIVQAGQGEVSLTTKPK